MKFTRIFIIAILLVSMAVALGLAADKTFEDGKGWGPSTFQIKIKLYTDKPSYKIGEQAKICVVANHDCYFMLYSVDSTGKASIICPSKFSHYNKLKKNKKLYIRDNKGNFLQQKGPAGKEILQVVATKDPIDVNSFSQYIQNTSSVTAVNNPGGFVTVVSREIKKRIKEAEKSWGPAATTTASGTQTSPPGVYGIATVTYAVK